MFSGNCRAVFFYVVCCLHSITSGGWKVGNNQRHMIPSCSSCCQRHMIPSCSSCSVTMNLTGHVLICSSYTFGILFVRCLFSCSTESAKNIFLKCHVMNIGSFVLVTLHFNTAELCAAHICSAFPLCLLSRIDESKSVNRGAESPNLSFLVFTWCRSCWEQRWRLTCSSERHLFSFSFWLHFLMSK
jgi:hypothetical protein